MPHVNRAGVTLGLAATIALAPLSGCKNLPGGEKTQGAVIGAGAGAAAGALIDREKRGRGALIGGLLGAGGGYLIGSSVKAGNDDEKRQKDAEDAGRRAREDPATADDVTRTSTADLNNDGFVTMDEVVAMEKAGLGDDEMLDRLRRTDQVFELTGQQERYLADRGVSDRVIRTMGNLNQGEGRTASDVDRSMADRPAGDGR